MDFTFLIIQFQNLSVKFNLKVSKYDPISLFEISLDHQLILYWGLSILIDFLALISMLFPDLFLPLNCLFAEI